MILPPATNQSPALSPPVEPDDTSPPPLDPIVGVNESSTDRDENEKGPALAHILTISSLSVYDDDGDLQDFGTNDPFPMDPDAPQEQQLTFRAVIVGCALGAVISASKYVRTLSQSSDHSCSGEPCSVYLGLKTGWTFGASLFGSIFGFAILKSLSKTLPERLGGGYFGPKENVCCQSAATVRSYIHQN